MISYAYKELYHFCTKRLSYLVILSIILTPATLLDYYFETEYAQNNSAYSYVLAHLMDIVSSVIGFLVVAYLYVHWHDHKKFYFRKFIETSLKKLYPTVSAFIWLLIFLAIPLFLLDILSGLITKIALSGAHGKESITDIISRANSLFSLVYYFTILIFGYFALKVSFVIYFAYKTGDKIGFSALKKTFKINFVEVIQYLATLGVYSVFYVAILFVMGFVVGLGSYELNYSYINLMGSGDSSLLLNAITAFFVTMLNIPFDVLYVAFAYELYNKYTKKK